MIVINRIGDANTGGAEGEQVANGFADRFYADVNADNRITPLDALLVINAMSQSSGEGEFGQFPLASSDDSTRDEALTSQESWLF